MQPDFIGPIEFIQEVLPEPFDVDEVTLIGWVGKQSISITVTTNTEQRSIPKPHGNDMTEYLADAADYFSQLVSRLNEVNGPIVGSLLASSVDVASGTFHAVLSYHPEALSVNVDA